MRHMALILPVSYLLAPSDPFFEAILTDPSNIEREQLNVSYLDISVRFSKAMCTVHGINVINIQISCDEKSTPSKQR